MNKHERIIIEYCNLTQDLIDELYKAEPSNETFEQVGMLEGKEIVNDYINHGEVRLALEHLLYMVHESDVLLPIEALKELYSVAKEYGIKVSHTNNA